jgi:ankyrin repeat protein
MDLLAAVALGDWAVAMRLVNDAPTLVDGGVLHIMAKRGDVHAVRWLLDHGASPNAIWSHWEANVTPMHLAAWLGHTAAVKLLLERGGDPRIRDSQFDGDVLGWAEHGQRADIVELLRR